eukprot:scaffold49781_cov37-Prasinocladus_malaysianus.AAC.1
MQMQRARQPSAWQDNAERLCAQPYSLAGCFSGTTSSDLSNGILFPDEMYLAEYPTQLLHRPPACAAIRIRQAIDIPLNSYLNTPHAIENVAQAEHSNRTQHGHQPAIHFNLHTLGDLDDKMKGCGQTRKASRSSGVTPACLGSYAAPVLAAVNDTA